MCKLIDVKIFKHIIFYDTSDIKCLTTQIKYLKLKKRLTIKELLIFGDFYS